MWFRTDSASVYVRFGDATGIYSRYRAKQPSENVREVKIDLKLPPETGDVCGVRFIRLVERERTSSGGAVGTVFDETAPIDFANPAGSSAAPSLGGGGTATSGGDSGAGTTPGGETGAVTPPGGDALLVRAAARQRIFRGVKARISCVGRCRVKARVIISAAMAKRYHTSTTVAVGTLSNPRARTVTVTAKASSRTRSRLKRAKSLRATVRVIVIDAAGVEKRGTARIVLTR